MRQPPNFDRLAAVYRWMEFASFGPWLWWCRCAFLAQLRHCKRALILGDGDGRFTARLLRINPAIHVDAVDLSAAMLRLLQQRAGRNCCRVTTHLADVPRQIEPVLAKTGDSHANSPYDLVVTHFFLDCLTTEEVRELASAIRPALAPDALWLVSEFAIPEGWFGRWIAAPLVGFLYLAFALLTGLAVRRLPDYHAALEENGFVCGSSRIWLLGLLASELWPAFPQRPCGASLEHQSQSWPRSSPAPVRANPDMRFRP